MWTEKIRSVFGWNKEEAGSGTRVDIACYTHTGKIRAHNEDNISFDGIFLEEEHQSLDQVLRWSAQIHEHPAVALLTEWVENGQERKRLMPRQRHLPR